MKIVRIDKLDDCFADSIIYGYSLESEWTREKIMRLSEIGTLDYFPEFPKPFFRVQCPSGLLIKGVQGEASCRVILPKRDKEEIKKQFEDWIVAN